MNRELAAADRRLRHAVLDAQCRDWTAERPDRLGFARLAQVHWEIERHRGFASGALDGWWAPATGALAATVFLLLADRAAAPLTLATAMTVGVLAAHAAFAVVRTGRKWRARWAVRGPAGIDNPYLYAELTRLLESEPPSEARDRAMFFLDAARDALIDRAATDAAPPAAGPWPGPTNRADS